MSVPLPLPFELHRKLCDAVAVLRADRPKPDGELRAAVDTYTEALRQVERGYELRMAFEPFAKHLLQAVQLGGHGVAIRALQERARAWLNTPPPMADPGDSPRESEPIPTKPRRR